MVERLNPDDFIITRKRKKYKFAKFANSPLCFELDEWKEILQGQTLQHIVVELGAGTGQFSVERAAHHPSRQFIAIDVKADRLQKGAYEAEEKGLKNIRFIRARADQLGEIVPQNSVSELWLTFPDPFPRRRSARRRMTHPLYLDIYRQLVEKEGAFYLKHDNREFFCWSLEQLVAQGWRLSNLSFDLHESGLPEDYKILTAYERRWLSEGLVTNFACALPPSAG